MRKLRSILFALAVLLPIIGRASIQLRPTDIFIATHDVLDSAGTAYTSADSVQVTVTFQDGTESLTAAWYNDADAEASLVNGKLYFFDAWDDLNGSDGVGQYTVLLRWYDGSSAALDFQETYIIQQTTMGLEDRSDSLQAVLDSVQAIMAKLILVQDTTQGTKDILDETLNVNLAQISGDGTAADNLEAMLDGTGGVDLDLAQITVTATGNDNAVTLLGSGTGEGLSSTGGLTGHGVQFLGGSTSGSGFIVAGTAGNSPGMMITGFGSAHGLDIDAGTYGDGINASGGSASGDGVQFAGTGTGLDLNAEVVINDTLPDGEELAVMPDDWVAADSTAYQGSASGLDSTAVAGAAQQALQDVGYNSADSTLDLTQLVVTATGNNTAVVFTGAGTGHGLQATGGATGHGLYSTGGVTSGDGVRFGAQGDGHGIRLISGATDDNAGFFAAGGGTNTYGAYIQGAGTKHGMRVKATGTGDDIVADIVGTVTPTDTTAAGKEIAVMPDDWVAADSTAFQGSASGLDSTAVARAVWNAPGLNHTGTGSFGAYLDAPISGVSGGSGAYSVTLVAFDTANTQRVSGVRLAVRNLDQSNLLALVGTGSSGTVAVNLDAGDYLVSASAPGYLFGTFDTLSFTGPATDSVFGYQFDPGAPGSPSLCRVYGYLYQTTGEPESDATISAHLPAGVSRSGSLIVSPYPTATTTDVNGYFYLDLLPSTSLTGSPLYEFTISRTDGTILRKRLSVPDTAIWQLAW